MFWSSAGWSSHYSGFKCTWKGERAVDLAPKWCATESFLRTTVRRTSLVICSWWANNRRKLMLRNRLVQYVCAWPNERAHLAHTAAATVRNNNNSKRVRWRGWWRWWWFLRRRRRLRVENRRLTGVDDTLRDVTDGCRLGRKQTQPRITCTGTSNEDLWMGRRRNGYHGRPPPLQCRTARGGEHAAAIYRWTESIIPCTECTSCALILSCALGWLIPPLILSLDDVFIGWINRIHEQSSCQTLPKITEWLNNNN